MRKWKFDLDLGRIIPTFVTMLAATVSYGTRNIITTHMEIVKTSIVVSPWKKRKKAHDQHTLSPFPSST
jgi:hypothetical protein